MMKDHNNILDKKLHKDIYKKMEEEGNGTV